MKNASFVKSALLFFCSALLFTGCANYPKNKTIPNNFKSVKIDKVFACSCSIRALIANRQHIFFAGSNGTFGYLNTADHSVEYVGDIAHKDHYPDFRSAARIGTSNLILSAGNPALLYKVNLFGKRKLLYTQDSEGTFYNSMAFWNQAEGLAIGDPVAGCLNMLITRNGGNTWQRIDCSKLPEAVKNEVAFAASNSNIAIVGEKTWVLTGGPQTRVYYSPDKGETWKVFDTPLIGGKNTTGGYSIDFYNAKTGVIIGGDYTQPQHNKANIAITHNGGKTWHLVADGENPGYKSCVKFVPKSGGRELVAVGPSGISYSADRGKTWIQLSGEGFYTLDFINDFTAYAAGKNKIVKLTFLAREQTN